MDSARPVQDDNLQEIVAEKIRALIREMEAVNWSGEAVALAIKQVIDTEWLDRIEALRDAREAFPKDYVSDGNEG